MDSDLFAKEMLREINEARTQPWKYAEKIKNHMKQIVTDDKGNSFYCFQCSSKISLPRGVKAFEECIEYLNNLFPCSELKLVDELKLPFPSKLPETATSREYITSALLEKATELKDKYKINWFHYDNNIYDAAVSTVLQLVDDNNSNGERRRHLMDPLIKHVGISIGHVKNSIHCIYLVFAS